MSKTQLIFWIYLLCSFNLQLNWFVFLKASKHQSMFIQNFASLWKLKIILIGTISNWRSKNIYVTTVFTSLKQLISTESNIANIWTLIELVLDSGTREPLTRTESFARNRNRKFENSPYPEPNRNRLNTRRVPEGS